MNPLGNNSATTMTEPLRFKTSPLISGTLIALYGALTLPLPFLAAQTAAPVSPLLLWGAIACGGILLWGALSQRVELDAQGICLTYPGWVPPSCGGSGNWLGQRFKGFSPAVPAKGAWSII